MDPGQIAQPAVQSSHYSIGAPSLVSIARRRCMKNVDEIESFGDAPLRLIEPIVKKIQYADQLRMLEEVSPQILPITPALWRSLIAKDIPNGNKNDLEPKNPENWWKVYRKLKREDDARKQSAEAQLRQALGEIRAEKDSHKSTILHSVLPGRPDRGTSLLLGVSSRSLGRDALSVSRQQKSTSAFRAAVSRRSTPNKPAIALKTSGTMRGIVSQAPRTMVQSYARRNGALPTAAPIPPPAAPKTEDLFARAPFQRRPKMRNPFSSKGNYIPPQEREALRLATQIEERARRAKDVESAKIAARTETRYAQAKGPSQTAAQTKATTSASALAITTTSTLAPKRRADGSGNEHNGAKEDRSPTPAAKKSRVSPPAQLVAVQAQPVKRKPINIFMAPAKRTKR